MPAALHPLREADGGGAPGQPSGAAPGGTPGAADAGKAARAALAQTLRERLALVAATEGELARLIDAALARIGAQLAGQPTDWQLWNLPRLMESIGRIVEELTAANATAASGAARHAWALGEQLVDGSVAAAANAAPGGAAVAPTVLGDAAAGLGQVSLAQLRALQHVTTERIKGASAELVRQVNGAVSQVVLGVETPFQAMQAVAKVLPDRTATQVRGIVTLSLHQAFNKAAFGKLQAQAARDPAMRKQWRRSGKRHSRSNHDAIDGEVLEVNKPFVVIGASGKDKGQPVQLMFPADPAAPVGETIHCGCTLLPWKATWRMRAAGPKPLTDAEKAARARGDGARGAKPRPAAAPAAPKVPTSASRALAAFGAGRGAGGGATWRDVGGLPLKVTDKLFPAGSGDARLTQPGKDLWSYWAVQGIKRPTEVWQQDRVDTASGEVRVQRVYLKRFEAAGRAWVGVAEFERHGAVWMPLGPYRIAPATAADTQALAPERRGVRVWPRRA